MSPLWFAAPVALAQDLQWGISSTAQTGTSWSETATCDPGFTAISGGATIDQVGPPESTLVGNAPSGTSWTGRWTSALGADPLPNDVLVASGALCADAPLLDCLHYVTLDTALTPVVTHDATVVCPPGTYLVGGGAELIGEHDGVAFRAAAPSGLLWPIGYRAIAEQIDGTPLDWAIRLHAWCGEPQVMPPLSVHDANFSVSQVWSGASNPTSYEEVGLGVYNGVPGTCGDPIAPGMAAWAPNVIAGMGWGADGTWTYRVHELERIGDPDWSTAKVRAVCATSLAAFEKSLDACDPPEPPPGSVDPFDLDVPAIGATILFGVIDGSSGVILLPGSGPVPVDPEWSMSWAAAAAALRVGVLPVDPRLSGSVIDAITDALDAEGVAWSVTTEISRTPGTPGVALVTPRDEQAAVDWLRDNRALFAGHPGLALLVLDQDGPALASMARWR